MGKPSAWDKAYYEKNLQTACRQFSTAAANASNAPVAASKPSKQARSKQPTQSGPPAGLDEFGKVLQLIKSLLGEADVGVQAKALWVIVQEQLPATAVGWMETAVTASLVHQAADRLTGLKAQAHLQSIMHSIQRLFRIIAAMLKPYSKPEDSKAVAGLSSTVLDCRPLGAVVGRVLTPVQQVTAGEVHPQYRAAILGNAINLCTSWVSLTMHPAMQDSQLQACVLEAACVTDLLPALCTLLAHASPAPSPCQGEDKWYESVTGITVQLIKAAKEGPAATSSLYHQGWQQAVLHPMVQEFLLERLIHGLRDASPTGLELPPGFASFGLLPGLCCPDESQLLPCLLLCLESQWMAWRVAQQGPPQQHWPGQQPEIGQVLEAEQLFELTRCSAEQAVLVVTEHVQSHQTAGDSDHHMVGLDSRMVDALAACTSCLTDLQSLWPGLSTSDKQVQLPLMLALAANALAFSSQALSIAAASGVSVAYEQPAVQPSTSDPRLHGGSTGQQPTGKAFGRGATVAPFATQPHGAYVSGNGGGGVAGRVATLLQECFTRSAAVVSFFFPVSREGAALAGPLPVLYAPPEWPGRLENQVSGVLGALEMALRGEHAPSAAIQARLLNAVTGILLAAPGSFWTHGQGQECTGVLSTVRKLANRSATVLEDSIAQAQQASKQMQSMGATITATSHTRTKEAVPAVSAIDWDAHQHVVFLYRLIMLLIDSTMSLTRPTSNDNSLDSVFVGGPDDDDGSHVLSSLPAQPQLSPSITVLMPADSQAVAAGGPQPLGPVGPQGRKGRGEAHPQGPLPEYVKPKRISEAQLTLRALMLTELLPPWLRLWNAQLAALAVAVQAELQERSPHSTIAGTRSPGRTRASHAEPSAEHTMSAEPARCQLMRSGLEWLAGIVRAVGPLCSSITQAHAKHVSGAGSATRGARPDASLIAVAKAAKEPVAALIGLDLIPLLRLQLQLESRRLAQHGVPEGQAGVLHAMAGLLHAQTALGANAKFHIARAAVEQHLLSELAALYDAQRKSGCRSANAAATMDALQVLMTAVQECLTDTSRSKVAPGATGSQIRRSVEEVRVMMAQLVTAPLPRAEDSDAGFDPQATALADVLIEESQQILKDVAGAVPAMDSVMASLRLHSGCCNTRCANMDQESEALLPLHMCQGCQKVLYCSRECQLAAWGTHQEQCRVWSSQH